MNSQNKTAIETVPISLNVELNRIRNAWKSVVSLHASKYAGLALTALWGYPSLLNRLKL
jgi:hypothetical protein